MSRHLLAIGLGPVQGFIAAARRTRDLWAGSYILSEISKAAAASLSQLGAQLVFPAPATLSDLGPGSPMSAPNRILTELPEGLEPEVASSRARRSAQARWLQFAEQALRLAGTDAIRMDIWRDQVEDVIEFYSAWVPLDGDYRESRARLERVFAGRKALRDFAPARGRAQVRKSSLDGARESVLREGARENAAIRRRLGLKRNEELDVPGVVKRCIPTIEGGQQVRFPSVARVASDPWIRRKASDQEGPNLLRNVTSLCSEDFAPFISSPQYQDFPFEPDVLYPSRLEAMIRDPDLADHWETFRRIKGILRGQKTSPTPYFATLLADGDRMGAFLSGMTSPEEHRDFSRRLSGFACEARCIVERNHGVMVYSGGDDVLAFLPVDTCMKCARELHDTFSETLDGLGPRPTLSVGVSIGHCMEPLEDLLVAAREAEARAKEGELKGDSDSRNGLAVCCRMRAGGEKGLRVQWGTPRYDRIQACIGWVSSGELPAGLAYDLAAMVGDYRGWPAAPAIPELLRGDVNRVLKRKKPGGKALSPEYASALLQQITRLSDLEHLADELMLARRLRSVSQDVLREWEASTSGSAPGQEKEGGAP